MLWRDFFIQRTFKFTSNTVVVHSTMGLRDLFRSWRNDNPWPRCYWNQFRL